MSKIQTPVCKFCGGKLTSIVYKHGELESDQNVSYKWECGTVYSCLDKEKPEIHYTRIHDVEYDDSKFEQKCCET